jgi:hypothetical protein
MFDVLNGIVLSILIIFGIAFGMHIYDVLHDIFYGGGKK